MPSYLECLLLKNFKCFESHKVYFNQSTIMMGQNNAGKTTVVEALRITGLATARFRNSSTFKTRPNWLEAYLPLSVKGINVSAKAIDTDLEHVFYRYGRPPAIIRAFFNNGVKIESYINSESELFCVFYYNGSNLCTHSRVIAAGVPDMRVLPQIVPLQKDEMIVSEDTLQKNRFSKRTSGNFRNNLLLHKDDTLMQKLKEMITETWSRLQIQEVLKDSDGRNVYLETPPTSV